MDAWKSEDPQAGFGYLKGCLVKGGISSGVLGILEGHFGPDVISTNEGHPKRSGSPSLVPDWRVYGRAVPESASPWGAVVLSAHAGGSGVGGDGTEGSVFQLSHLGMLHVVGLGIRSPGTALATNFLSYLPVSFPLCALCSPCAPDDLLGPFQL